MPVSPKTRQSDLAAKIAAAMALPAQNKYATTTASCMCTDHRYRGRVCKHIRELRAAHKLCEVCGAPWCDGDHTGEVL